MIFTHNNCESVRMDFSAYLDGAVSGIAMAEIASHLDACVNCAEEFEGLKTVQQSLAALGPATAPADLQATLRRTIAVERERGTHLGFVLRLARAWDAWLAQAMLRGAGAFAAALVILGGLGWMFSAPLAVQANDERMSHLIAPHYLYSSVLERPIDSSQPIVVEAKVDTEGRVYDYAILTGPSDAGAQLQVQQNLLASVFKPATVFGVPVRGHVVMTYVGVSVRG